jgi:DNA-binding ferritin-like protein (Dps family)
VEETVKQVLELVEEKADAELEELDDVVGEDH